METIHHVLDMMQWSRVVSARSYKVNSDIISCTLIIHIDTNRQVTQDTNCIAIIPLYSCVVPLPFALSTFLAPNFAISCNLYCESTEDLDRSDP